MYIAALDVKAFLSDYGWAFALAAALLLIILIIVSISGAVKVSRLKRENRILAREANRAGRLMATADKEGAAAADSAESGPTGKENAAQKKAGTAAPGGLLTEENKARSASPNGSGAPGGFSPAPRQGQTSAASPAKSEETARQSAQKPAAQPAARQTVKSDEADEEVTDESGRVKYTVKYDRSKLNWVIIKEGNERPTRRVATKSEAMAVARELSKKHDAALTVHKKDGKFQKQ